MGYQIDRMKKYETLTDEQIRELYRRNFLKMARYQGFAPHKYQRCLRIEKILDKMCVGIHLNANGGTQPHRRI